MKNVQSGVAVGHRPQTCTSFYRAVILSPHWDDAVFSAGGHLAHLQEEGQVLVLNLFTDYPEYVKSWGLWHRMTAPLKTCRHQCAGF
ncbi:MAG: hypothetical protein IPN90_11105 [Elusimicrobia bacterium]|nr:hypothetical protein [Elusimicrobiota bacterium]